MPGLVALVDRGGRTEAAGLGAGAVGGPPVARDTIFRISSMTKPVTAVAALMLVEECVLRLETRSTPAARARRPPGAQPPRRAVDDTVPAESPITVRDLLTFRWASAR